MQKNMAAVTVGALLGVALVGGSATAAQANDTCPTWNCTPTVVGTGGIGVGWRDAPDAAVTGYGAAEGSQVPVSCWESGPAVGSNGNTIWWKVIDGRGQWFVSDHWLNTPAPYTSGGVMRSPVGGQCIG
jgi:hypothetical protein